MSFLKSVGIDVGIIAKGLNYQVSLANSRLDSLLGGSSLGQLNANVVAYDPVSIANWGTCGCASISNVSSALNELAKIRAYDIDDLNNVDTRVSALEQGTGGGGLSNWSEDGNGSLLPNGNDSQDLGSASKKVRDLYLGPSSLKIVGDDDITQTYNKQWFEDRASQVSLGNIDTRLQSQETLSIYTVAELPSLSSNGTQALVSDGTDTGIALAYHYDRGWYRSYDNLILADSKWNPSNTTTELWYDASDTNSLIVSGTDLTQWNDKSGNGYNLTKDQNASSNAQSGITTLRGRNVIEFSAGDSMTNLAWSHSQNTTPIYIAFVTKAYVDGNQDFLFHHTSATNQRQALRRTTSNGYGWLGSNADNTSIAGVILTGCPEGEDTLGLVKASGSNSSLTKYNQTGTGTITGNFGTRDLEHISIGSNEIEQSQLVGYFAEIVYFTNASDVEKVEGYLAHKWGLEAYLSSGHIYRNLAP